MTCLQEQGQGMVEYGLVIVLVAIVVVAILVMVGPAIGQMFSSLTSHL